MTVREQTIRRGLAGGHYSFSAELGMDTTFCKVPTGTVVSAPPVELHQRRTLIEETSSAVEVNEKRGAVRCFRAYPRPYSKRNPSHRPIESRRVVENVPIVQPINDLWHFLNQKYTVSMY